MAPTLFSMMFSAMLTDAFQDVDAAFPIRYRFEGKLLNLRRLQAKSKVQTDVVDKLLYAHYANIPICFIPQVSPFYIVKKVK